MKKIYLEYQVLLFYDILIYVIAKYSLVSLQIKKYI